MIKLITIALGGAIGALLRYSLSGLVHKIFEEGYPWGTLVVNLLGCFAIGFLWEYFMNSLPSPELRSLIFIGILGAFTTFSTFGLETLNLVRDGEWRLAMLNIVANNIGGLVFVFCGFVTARFLLKVLR